MENDIIEKKEETKTPLPKNKRIRRIIICIVVVIFLLSLIFLTCVTIKADYFTEEQHIKRISRRFQKKYMNEGSEIDSFEVYPIYDENENISMFLIECNPYGFMFVEAIDYGPLIIVPLILGSTMYLGSRFYGHKNSAYATWTPYTYDENGEYNWALDESGEKICYSTSPYRVQDKMKERKYIFQSERGGYVCAVKDGANFVNLISGRYFEFKNGKMEKIKRV